MAIGNEFDWPYEVRESEPESGFGIFIQQNGRNFGPTGIQFIKGGIFRQVVRFPVRVLDLGPNIVIGNVTDDGTISLDVVGGGGGGFMPSNSFHLVAQQGVNGNAVKSGSGVLTGVNASGAKTSSSEYPLYVKLYDSTGVGELPDPLCVVAVQMGLQSPDPVPAGGISFTTGLFMKMVAGIQDDDDTPVQAGDLVADVCFQ